MAGAGMRSGRKGVLLGSHEESDSAVRGKGRGLV